MPCSPCGGYIAPGGERAGTRVEVFRVVGKRSLAVHPHFSVGKRFFVFCNFAFGFFYLRFSGSYFTLPLSSIFTVSTLKSINLVIDALLLLTAKSSRYSPN